MRSMGLFLRRHRGAACFAAYRVGFFIKSFVELLLSALGALTLLRSARRRAGICAWVFLWQLLACPDSMGLKDAKL